MLLALGRRLVQRAPRQLGQQRGMAGHGDYPPVPKPDRSLDHVFGDNSYKVDFDVRSLGGFGPNVSMAWGYVGIILTSYPFTASQFKPPAMLTTFLLTAATLAVFGFPAWMMVYEENKYENFKAT